MELRWHLRLIYSIIFHSSDGQTMIQRQSYLFIYTYTAYRTIKMPQNLKTFNIFLKTLNINILV